MCALVSLVVVVVVIVVVCCVSLHRFATRVLPPSFILSLSLSEEMH